MKRLAIIYLTCLAFGEPIAIRIPRLHKHSGTKVEADYRKTNDLTHFGNSLYRLPNSEAGRRVQKWRKGDKVNPEELGGYTEGDLVLGISLKNGWFWEEFRWPGARIPYTISKIGFTKEDRAMIQLAMDEIHNHTCIRFVPRDNERAFVRFTSKFTGCHSGIGYTGQSYDLNLQSGGCTAMKGTVLHELMHAIGFVHEHSRAERDDYVTIHLENVEPKELSNFEKFPRHYMKYYDVSYNYASVMHYSRYAFSKNGGETVVPKDPTVTNMGQRDGFTSGDILKINRMYKCDEQPHTANKISTPVKRTHRKKRTNSTHSKQPPRVQNRPAPRDRVYCSKYYCWVYREPNQYGWW